MDNNKELIETYGVVKNNLSQLIALLKEFKKEYDKDSEGFYYEIREWDRKKDWAKRSNLEKAARTIFLNKTCYNGLYRVNSKGQFNTPIGRYSNPTICDEINLRAVNVVIQRAKLITADFEKTIELANKNDFIYFDPPYHPLNDTSNFTSYTKQDFDEQDQKRLKDVFEKLSEKSCKVMLSNSDTSFVKKLYSKFNINKVKANRFINCKSDNRGKLYELVITNY
jgi:DNA adenine methylase